MKIENLTPNSINLAMAMTACSVYHIIFADSKSYSFDQFPATERAESIFASLARNIPAIDISEPCPGSNLSGSMKRCGRGSWMVEHLIRWIEG